MVHQYLARRRPRAGRGSSRESEDTTPGESAGGPEGRCRGGVKKPVAVFISSYLQMSSFTFYIFSVGCGCDTPTRYFCRFFCCMNEWDECPKDIYCRPIPSTLWGSIPSASGGLEAWMGKGSTLSRWRIYVATNNQQPTHTKYKVKTTNYTI